MADISYNQFLNLLVEKTKTKEIKWHYLDENKTLINMMGWQQVPFLVGEPTPNFDTEDSFYSKSRDTTIVIYVHENNPASLYVIPSTYKKIVYLSADEYGDQITRLLNLVQSQFPSGDQFIKSFIYDSLEEI